MDRPSWAAMIVRAGLPALFLLSWLACPELTTAQTPPPTPPGVASTVQLPTFGVAVDAEGLVKHVAIRDPDGRLTRERLAAAKAALPLDLRARSPLRKVSLRRLESALRAQCEAGVPPDDAMRHLAGLQRLQAVFYFPELGEIVIAGPAEGWMPDAVGRAVGATTNRPVLLLEDLLAALRAYPPGGRAKPLVGCTIHPTREGWERFVAFEKKIPRTVPQAGRDEAAARIAVGSREALGMAEITVLGISNRTHMAAIMVEADYRMKLIAIGLEPPPIKLKSYLDLLGGAPRKQSAQRWWFTPDYECIRATDDSLAMELVGEGVILQEEDQFVSRDGQVAADTRIDGAAQSFAAAFTRKYGSLAAASPVFAELRNCIDLLVAAAYIRHQDFCGDAAWDMALLLDEDRLPIETCTTPRKVDSAVNAVWKGNRLLAPLGGISIHADRALDAERLSDKNGKLHEKREAIGTQLPATRWWWD